jgi:hypothetical protein
MTSALPSAQAPISVPADAWDFTRWLFSDPARACWGLTYLVVLLAAVILVAWILAPYLGALISVGADSVGIHRGLHESNQHPRSFATSSPDLPSSPDPRPSS